MNRAEFLGVLAASCVPQRASGARLNARPIRNARNPHAAGTHDLDLGTARDGLLLVPRTAAPAGGYPLVVALHGAGGEAQGPLRAIGPLAEESGFLVLSVDSRGPTWDAIREGFGPDVAFLDRALRLVFAHHPVNAARIFVEGFSDGASYALGLGLANGDLFSKIVAFSPGFIPPGGGFVGSPGIFVSHGTNDRILRSTAPAGGSCRCSRAPAAT